MTSAFSSSTSPRTPDPLWSSPFLKACRREPTEVTPIWLMRQAGRYMAEYRAIRSQVSFLELCKRPELATEVTVTAAERLGVDAAILFADILLILEPLGLDLEFAKGEGPVIHNPVRTAADVDRVRPLEDVDLARLRDGGRSLDPRGPAAGDAADRLRRGTVHAGLLSPSRAGDRGTTNRPRRSCIATLAPGTPSWSA